MSTALVAMVMLLLLVVIFAAASLFRHRLGALLVLLTVPCAVFLAVLFGAFYTFIALGVVAMLVALIRTITDTLRLLRAARGTAEQATHPLTEDHARPRRSQRSRIAA
jgi:hypothetical protein